MKNWCSILTCALLMSGCASVSPQTLPSEFYTCPAPQPYPEDVNALSLIEALNDTYLAWEECAASLESLKATIPVRSRRPY